MKKAAGRPAVPSKYKQRAMGYCAVCGGPGRWDLSDLLGDSFTNWTSCARPDSTVACAACLFCLKEPALKLGGFLALGAVDGVRGASLLVFETTAQTVTRLRSPQGKQSTILACELPPEAAEKCGSPPRRSTPGEPLTTVLPRADFWRLCLESPPEPPFACALNVAGGMPLPRHMPIASRTASSPGMPSSRLVSNSSAVATVMSGSVSTTSGSIQTSSKSARSGSSNSVAGQSVAT